MAIVLSVVSVIVASAAAIANWWEASATVGLLKTEIAKNNYENARIAIEEWQELVVFSIIEKGFRENKFQSGLGFDAIKSEYLDEAKTVKEVELGEDDIQPTTLRRILLRLIRNQVVFKTDADGYVVNRSELLDGFGRLNQTRRASYDIVYILATESGKFNDQKLQTRIIEKFQLTPQEYRYLVNQMIANGYVVRDSAGFLHSASTQPSSASD